MKLRNGSNPQYFSPNKTHQMKSKLLLLSFCPTLIATSLTAQEIKSPAGVTVTVNEGLGVYAITYSPRDWKFSGQLAHVPTEVSTTRGTNSIGAYSEISWSDGFLLRDSVRIYDAQPVALFTITSSQPTKNWPADFPNFDNFPKLHQFSFRETVFAKPRFGLETNATPWLLFDDSAGAAIISPADNFLIASMNGDGTNRISSGMNPKVHDLPGNFSHSTLMVFGDGIHSTWKTWSGAFLELQGAPRPGNDADIGLRYLGYWTDNGGTYYYNYNTNVGYAGTLEILANIYRDEHIPIRYMQLDSWWYHKTFTGPDGKAGQTKNPKLPPGEWNRYGGLLDYHADKAVLPEGLGGFHKDINLPLITHNRWIDPASPYHDKYQISGFAAVDPKFWDHLMSDVSSNGDVCYEQDWLNVIYEHSPELQSTLGVGDAFTDNMARAAKQNNMSLQYCMALPRFFLQGSRYPNLTTIRTSDDRFGRDRWDDFLYVSQLARAVGIWPFADVFMSTERDNLLISVLSAGMVGFGDKMGDEDKDNLSRAARPDGVLVKPDESLLPVDDVYVSQASGQKNPMVAWTYTDHGPLRTAYVFAYVRESTNMDATFTPTTCGLDGKVCVYNAGSGQVSFQSADTAVPLVFDLHNTAYYEVVPVGKSGIAFFGDEGKFVSNGKQRIANITEADKKLTATITFAKDEPFVRVFGFAKKKPKVTTPTGSITGVDFDKATGRFAVNVLPSPDVNTDGTDSTQTAIVTFSER
jgi:hypothetical protein